METMAICLLVCICILHVIPLIPLTWREFNTSPYSISPRRVILSRARDRTLIFSNLRDLLRDNPGLRSFLGKYALLACSFHLFVIIIFVLAMQNDVDVPFLPSPGTLLPEDMLNEYVKFSIACGIIQMLPVIALIFVLYYNNRYRLPITYEEASDMTKADITSLEDLSEDFGTIRLTRFEDSKKTIIFANCRDFQTGRLLKLALCQNKDEPNETECYRMIRKLKTPVKLDTTPFHVDDLVKTFDAAKK